MNEYKDVFISYHRSDGSAMAQLIEEKLIRRGYSVFLDYHSIEKGDYDEQIMDQLAHTKDFILILSPAALDNCEDPQNWLRREIEQALGNRVNVIPVFMYDFRWPVRMPLSILPIKTRQGVNFNFEYTDASVERICGLMNAQPVARETQSVQPEEQIGKQLQKGDIVHFGSYPQTADGETREPIEWVVLDTRRGYTLLISKYALDAKPFHFNAEEVTWETCTLRKWLNEDFFGTAFNGDEQKRIAATVVKADKKPAYSVDPGNATHDKVFLLSEPEVEKYFNNRETRMCAPTWYAEAQGAWTSDTYLDTYKTEGIGTCYWWLRSPGSSCLLAGLVYYNGIFSSSEVEDENGSVRPAVWARLT